MGSDKHLKLRAASTSGLGRVITHLQQGSNNQQELASATLQSRFLPFAMDRDEAEFREVAIRCATECEAWAKAIREYAELGVYPSMAGMMMGQYNPSVPHSIVDGNEEVDEDNEDDEDDGVIIDEPDELGF